MRRSIPAALRQGISDQADHRCGYCRSAEETVGASMEIDHIVPLALGGPTDEENLWLACSQCNDHENDRAATVDPQTGELCRLYHPRLQHWNEHFSWSADGTRIVGRTPTGRATVVALHLNRPPLVSARAAWTSVGWHPPQERCWPTPLPIPLYQAPPVPPTACVPGGLAAAGPGSGRTPAPCARGRPAPRQATAAGAPSGRG